MNTALCMCCSRDWDLAQLMVWSLRRAARQATMRLKIVLTFEAGDVPPGLEMNRTYAGGVVETRIRPPGFGHWGWESSCVKLNEVARCLGDVMGDAEGHESWLLCVDSDVVFVSPGIFDVLTWSWYKRSASLGFPHCDNSLGDAPHFAGYFMALAPSVVRRIHAYGGVYDQVRASMSGLCVNEDVVLSRIASECGPRDGVLSELIHCQDLRGALTEGDTRGRSVIHLGMPDVLGGPKWDFPRRLRQYPSMAPLLAGWTSFAEEE